MQLSTGHFISVVRVIWIAGALVGALAGSLMLNGCAEPASSGTSVTIPIVNISCVTTRCRAAATARAFIVYTTSSCANPTFGETVAGSTTLTCNGTVCSGSVSSFTNQSGLSANTIREGFYSVCVVVDFNGNYVGTPVSGQDTTGALGDSLITTGTSAKTVTAFSDI